MSPQSMVDKFLRPRGIEDERVLRAMASIRRELFVPEALKEKAYSDFPLPIGEDQTISQPYIVALMTEQLKLTGQEKVLEIGTGSGYQTAILAKLAKQVFSIERFPKLATEARNRIEKLNLHNVSIKTGNGALGWREFAPFDRILLTAAAAEFPYSLFEQLANGGTMVLPIGKVGEEQELWSVRNVNGKEERRMICRCSFVPFVV